MFLLFKEKCYNSKPTRDTDMFVFMCITWDKEKGGVSYIILLPISSISSTGTADDNINNPENVITTPKILFIFTDSNHAPKHKLFKV